MEETFDYLQSSFQKEHPSVWLISKGGDGCIYQGDGMKLTYSDASYSKGHLDIPSCSIQSLADLKHEYEDSLYKRPIIRIVYGHVIVEIPDWRLDSFSIKPVNSSGHISIASNIVIRTIFKPVYQNDLTAHDQGYPTQLDLVSASQEKLAYWNDLYGVKYVDKVLKYGHKSGIINPDDVTPKKTAKKPKPNPVDPIIAVHEHFERVLDLEGDEV